MEGKWDVFLAPYGQVFNNLKIKLHSMVVLYGNL